MKKFLVCFLLASASAITKPTPLPFIQDDFGKARAQAVERKLPIFVECWAPL